MNPAAPLLLLVALLTAQTPDPAQPIGKLSDATIEETSGIVKSRKYPGIYWIESDSGNPATIHAIHANGRVVASFPIAALNVDWEDIATDDAGHLYLADTGNNGHLLPMRAIYRFEEPNPATPARKQVAVKHAYYYTFPSKEERFDAESLIIYKNHAYLIEKRRDGKEPSLYRLDLAKPATMLKPVVPERLGKLAGFAEPATGASLSPDGKRLAVVSTKGCRIYDWNDGARLTLRTTVRYKEKHIEAVTWDGLDLILATEPGEMFRIASTSLTK